MAGEFGDIEFTLKCELLDDFLINHRVLAKRIGYTLESTTLDAFKESNDA